MSAAGGIIFNEKGQLLIVKPIYHDRGWLIPGGVIEKNESPMNACIREIREEIGLDLKPDKLLCLDYHSSDDLSKDENYIFLFHIGVINQKQINEIILQDTELSEYRFVHYHDAGEMLTTRLSFQVGNALKAMKESHFIYVENRNEIK